jgi:hypothetical protein
MSDLSPIHRDIFAQWLTRELAKRNETWERWLRNAFFNYEDMKSLIKDIDSLRHVLALLEPKQERLSPDPDLPPSREPIRLVTEIPAVRE